MVARARHHVKKGTDMNEMTGGRAVVEVLKAEGVRHVFGIVGATFLDVLDALYDDRSVEYVNVRHEQAAAFMADGLARVTDLPGVCLVTSGPGATNLLTGVAAAHVAHSPVVVLVGGVSLDHQHRDGSRNSTWSACSGRSRSSRCRSRARSAFPSSSAPRCARR